MFVLPSESMPYGNLEFVSINESQLQSDRIVTRVVSVVLVEVLFGFSGVLVWYPAQQQ